MLKGMFHHCRATLSATAVATSVLAGSCASTPISAPQPTTPTLKTETQAYAAAPLQAKSTNPVPVIEVKANAPERYVIKRGDTPWDIAS